MRNLTSASETRTRALASPARPARLLLTLAALALLCVADGAALALAQKGQPTDAEAARKAEEAMERAAASHAVRRPWINVKPFEDLALAGKRLADEGKLGPDTTLDVSATAEVGEDGSLKPETAQIFWLAPTDETLSQLTRQLLTAVSESRVLGALEGAKSVRFGLKLDRRNVSVLVASEMRSAADAQKYAQGYDILRQFGAEAMRSRGAWDEKELYERLRFASDGKMFKMSFEMPRDEAGRVIADMLARRAAKAGATR